MLAACGFKPVHAKLNNGISSQLAAIQITDIPGREGQIVKYKLAELLSPDSAGTYPAYRLDIRLAQQKNELGIQEDLRVTRYDIVSIADYNLVSLANNQIIYTDKSKIKSSFNRTESEFSTFVAEEDAYEKAAEELAQDIKQRMAAFFSRQ